MSSTLFHFWSFLAKLNSTIVRMSFFIKFVASSSLMVSSQIRHFNSLIIKGEKINIKKSPNVTWQTRADVYTSPDRCKWQMHSRASPILYSTVQRKSNISIREENTGHTCCLSDSITQGYSSFWRERIQFWVWWHAVHALYMHSSEKSQETFFVENWTQNLFCLKNFLL